MATLKKLSPVQALVVGGILDLYGDSGDGLFLWDHILPRPSRPESILDAGRTWSLEAPRSTVARDAMVRALMQAANSADEQLEGKVGRAGPSANADDRKHLREERAAASALADWVTAAWQEGQMSQVMQSDHLSASDIKGLAQEAAKLYARPLKASEQKFPKGPIAKARRDASGYIPTPYLLVGIGQQTVQFVLPFAGFTRPGPFGDIPYALVAGFPWGPQTVRLSASISEARGTIRQLLTLQFAEGPSTSDIADAIKAALVAAGATDTARWMTDNADREFMLGLHVFAPVTDAIHRARAQKLADIKAGKVHPLDVVREDVPGLVAEKRLSSAKEWRVAVGDAYALFHDMEFRARGSSAKVRGYKAVATAAEKLRDNSAGTPNLVTLWGYFASDPKQRDALMVRALLAVAVKPNQTTIAAFDESLAKLAEPAHAAARSVSEAAFQRYVEKMAGAFPSWSRPSGPGVSVPHGSTSVQPTPDTQAIKIAHGLWGRPSANDVVVRWPVGTESWLMLIRESVDSSGHMLYDVVESAVRVVGPVGGIRTSRGSVEGVFDGRRDVVDTAALKDVHTWIASVVSAVAEPGLAIPTIVPGRAGRKDVDLLALCAQVASLDDDRYGLNAVGVQPPLRREWSGALTLAGTDGHRMVAVDVPGSVAPARGLLTLGRFAIFRKAALYAGPHVTVFPWSDPWPARGGDTRQKVCVVSSQIVDTHDGGEPPDVQVVLPRNNDLRNTPWGVLTDLSKWVKAVRTAIKIAAVTGRTDGAGASIRLSLVRDRAFLTGPVESFAEEIPEGIDPASEAADDVRLGWDRKAREWKAAAPGTVYHGASGVLRRGTLSGGGIEQEDGGVFNSESGFNPHYILDALEIAVTLGATSLRWQQSHSLGPLTLTAEGSLVPCVQVVMPMRLD